MTRYGVYVVWVLLVVVFSRANERFFTVENLVLILQQASPLGIAVVGMVFVLLVVGIDISVGRSMFFISTLVGFMITRWGIIPEAYFSDMRGPCLTLGFVVILF